MSSAAFASRPAQAGTPHPAAGHHHSQPTASDLELLDLLCSMPSTFPHSHPSPASGPHVHLHPSPPMSPLSHPRQSQQARRKSRPLATLSALRRPPLDPIVLAASLSSGPHVTRHHFHHQFGGGAGGEGGARPTVDVVLPPLPPPPASTGPPPAEQQPAAAVTEKRRYSHQSAYSSCDSEHPAQPELSHTSPAALPSQLDGRGRGPSGDLLGLSTAPTVAQPRELYASRQAPRHIRLQREKEEREHYERLRAEAAKRAQQEELRKEDEEKRRKEHIAFDREREAALAKMYASLGRSAAQPDGALADGGGGPSTPISPHVLPPTPAATAARAKAAARGREPAEPLKVRCHARTRIPTPHGEVFLHIYKNNRDDKEHLALVVDPAQAIVENGGEGQGGANGDAVGKRHALLRSKTLDEVWDGETEMERIVRGAYVGRLGPNSISASKPQAPSSSHHAMEEEEEEGPPAPLVRIHSECYTGETIGSQRCDCGEQLDEAIRLISTPPPSSSSSSSRRHFPRGVVVYLRQEGRGIGLLDKIMAYNLQDMGHDTVAANILLGHLPDARRYDVAAEILRDLGVEECRLLTNNPEKMEALESEGVVVRQRVGMVPRAWRCGVHHSGERKKKKKKVRKEKKERSRSKAEEEAAEGKKEGRRKKGMVDNGMVNSAEELSSSSVSPGHHRHRDRSNRLQSSTSKNRLLDELLPQDESTPVSVQSQQGSEDEDEEDGAHVSAITAPGSSDSDSDSGSDSGSSSFESDSSSASHTSYISHLLRRAGATMLGGSVTRGPELEKYLRTKVEKMGHLLDLPPEREGEGETESGGREAKK